MKPKEPTSPNWAFVKALFPANTDLDELFQPQWYCKITVPVDPETGEPDPAFKRMVEQFLHQRDSEERRRANLRIVGEIDCYKLSLALRQKELEEMNRRRKIAWIRGTLRSGILGRNTRDWLLVFVVNNVMATSIAFLLYSLWGTYALRWLPLVYVVFLGLEYLWAVARFKRGKN